MKKYRQLCEDIIEHTIDTLNKDNAIKILRDQLRDLSESLSVQ